MNLLIKGGRIVDPRNNLDQVGDLLIEKDRIARVDSEISAGGAKVLDAHDKIVIPGLIDLHAHLRQPGREDEETLVTASRAAARGGFTAVSAMPNTDPVIDNQGAVEFILTLAGAIKGVRIYPVGAITKDLRGAELAPMAELKAAGAVAVSDDGNPVSDSLMMRRGLEYARMVGLPVISHSEDLDLTGKGVMNEGIVSTTLGLPGIPAAAEVVMVSRDLELARLTGGRLHLAHLSCAGSVNLVRQAKKEGVRVTAETCPHYFALTDEAVKSFGTNFKMKPPLRRAEDVEAIKAGLADGTIDAIATDHAPHTENEKQVEFDYAPFGITGLETAFSLAYQKLVLEKVISLSELVKKMSGNPARILDVDGGELSVGSYADVTIIDLEKKWEVKKDGFFSKSKNSPFIDWALPGVVEATVCAGRIIYGRANF